ncbi:GTP-binding protein [Actinocrinis sp.]|uniref:GTP-binding protein n=1 Tax=Actinocrinis sp. TaxID=1920516 RepID=UPI002C619E39|nr:GTP-binding protein [Actinocrinis sp.]HXR70296.1 GTP-binding protein [Actinocrinis sp.]
MITLVPLSGFLGSGKTTTLISAAIAMQRTGRRVAVVTNDPGAGLVDTNLARGGLDEVAELAGGCLCRRLPDLAALLADADMAGKADVVLVEASGSCADLRNTVVRPLRERYRGRMTVAPLTAVVDPLRLAAFTRAAERCEPEPDLGYVFGRQLVEAELLAINKTDLIGDERTAKLEARLAADYPRAAVLPYSATTGVGLEELIRAWTRPNPALESQGAQVRAVRGEPKLDFTRYADAESQVAWLNEAFRVTAAESAFDAVAWAKTVLRQLSEWSAAAGYFVGHIKLAVRTPAGLAKLSVTDTGAPPQADRAAARPVEYGYATINARVVCPPSTLDDAVRAAIAAADKAHRATSHGARPSSFRSAHRRYQPQRLAATG